MVKTKHFGNMIQDDSVMNSQNSDKSLAIWNYGTIYGWISVFLFT